MADHVHMLVVIPPKYPVFPGGWVPDPTRIQTPSSGFLVHDESIRDVEIVRRHDYDDSNLLTVIAGDSI